MSEITLHVLDKNCFDGRTNNYYSFNIIQFLFLFFQDRRTLKLLKAKCNPTNKKVASLLQMWKDVQLTWRPQSYDGIRQIRVPVDKIWKPDIVLYTKYVKTIQLFYFPLFLCGLIWEVSFSL